MTEEQQEAKKGPTKPRPRANYLSGLQLALARRDNGIPLSPELTAMLAEHEKVRA